jgi:hypothetical protein
MILSFFRYIQVLALDLGRIWSNVVTRQLLQMDTGLLEKETLLLISFWLGWEQLGYLSMTVSPVLPMTFCENPIKT